MAVRAEGDVEQAQEGLQQHLFPVRVRVRVRVRG